MILTISTQHGEFEATLPNWLFITDDEVRDMADHDARLDDRLVAFENDKTAENVAAYWAEFFSIMPGWKLALVADDVLIKLQQRGDVNPHVGTWSQVYYAAVTALKLNR